jgi:hypothetical protein
MRTSGRHCTASLKQVGDYETMLLAFDPLGPLGRRFSANGAPAPELTDAEKERRASLFQLQREAIERADEIRRQIDVIQAPLLAAIDGNRDVGAEVAANFLRIKLAGE